MVIKTVEVSARGAHSHGVVTLNLTQTPAGWTYRVDGMQDEAFTLTWHARSPEGASRKLQDVYDPTIWKLTITETG